MYLLYSVICPIPCSYGLSWACVQIISPCILEYTPPEIFIVWKIVVTACNYMYCISNRIIWFCQVVLVCVIEGYSGSLGWDTCLGFPQREPAVTQYLLLTGWEGCVMPSPTTSPVTESSRRCFEENSAVYSGPPSSKGCFPLHLRLRKRRFKEATLRDKMSPLKFRDIGDFCLKHAWETEVEN